ncbi:flagellar motor protein MotD [endosymbiont of Lamellibrachia barhami]|uniref:flagellar motor protein MotD n=1 Tax=endosymbiont of Lamellibrachia barhami TaxID=205975 RepID=UPI0015B33EBD|nr:flagellar motor protein MotD [endosymbiont of Lamellibrachia barhami]
MARRRKRHVEQENHERWVVSYADFITLLFAFFVVMYSISSVNEGKYRVLSQTLSNAFQEPSRSQEPIQIGEISRSSGDPMGAEGTNALIQTEIRFGPGTYDDDGLLDNAVDEGQRLSYLAATIGDMLEPYIEKDLVDVSHSDTRVIVDMKNKMLFPSGSAKLSRAAVKVLRDISSILRPLKNQLQIEGYTDNQPIHTPEYPSNWELSAARAASVVHLIARMGVAPERLAAIGYGEHRPIADNDSETGRQKNRRVSLVILGMNGDSDRTIILPGGGR